jgi:hypothetical protein
MITHTDFGSQSSSHSTVAQMGIFLISSPGVQVQPAQLQAWVKVAVGSHCKNISELVLGSFSAASESVKPAGVRMQDSLASSVLGLTAMLVALFYHPPAHTTGVAH